MMMDQPNDDLTESDGEVVEEISNQFYGAYPLIDRSTEKVKIVVRVAVHTKDPVIVQSINFLLKLAR